MGPRAPAPQVHPHHSAAPRPGPRPRLAPAAAPRPAPGHVHRDPRSLVRRLIHRVVGRSRRPPAAAPPPAARPTNITVHGLLQRVKQALGKMAQQPGPPSLAVPAAPRRPNLPELLPGVLSGLSQTFAGVECQLSKCPDLSQPPFGLGFSTIGSALQLRTTDLEQDGLALLGLFQGYHVYSNNEPGQGMRINLRNNNPANSVNWKPVLREALAKKFGGDWELLCLEVVENVTQVHLLNHGSSTGRPFSTGQVWLFGVTQLFIDEPIKENGSTINGEEKPKKKVVRKVKATNPDGTPKKRIVKKKPADPGVEPPTAANGVKPVVQEIVEDPHSVSYMVRMGQSPVKEVEAGLAPSTTSPIPSTTTPTPSTNPTDSTQLNGFVGNGVESNKSNSPACEPSSSSNSVCTVKAYEVKSPDLPIVNGTQPSPVVNGVKPSTDSIDDATWPTMEGKKPVPNADEKLNGLVHGEVHQRDDPVCQTPQSNGTTLTNGFKQEDKFSNNADSLTKNDADKLNNNNKTIDEHCVVNGDLLNKPTLLTSKGSSEETSTESNGLLSKVESAEASTSSTPSVDGPGDLAKGPVDRPTESSTLCSDLEARPLQTEPGPSESAGRGRAEIKRQATEPSRPSHDRHLHERKSSLDPILEDIPLERTVAQLEQVVLGRSTVSERSLPPKPDVGHFIRPGSSGLLNNNNNNTFPLSRPTVMSPTADILSSATTITSELTTLKNGLRFSAEPDDASIADDLSFSSTLTISEAPKRATDRAKSTPVADYGSENKVRGMKDVPVIALQLVLSTVSYKEMNRLRRVHPHWDELCGQLLNSGYYELIHKADILMQECQRRVITDDKFERPLQVLTNLQVHVLNPVDMLRAAMDEGVLCFPYGEILDMAFTLLDRIEEVMNVSMEEGDAIPLNWEKISVLSRRAQVHYRRHVEPEVEKRMSEVYKLSAQQRLQRLDSFLVESSVSKLEQRQVENRDELRWEMEQLKEQNKNLKKDNRELKKNCASLEGRIEALERKFKTMARLLQS